MQVDKENQRETPEERIMMILLTMHFQKENIYGSNCGICPAEGSFVVMFPQVIEDNEELMKVAMDLIKTEKEGVELC